MSQPFLLFSGSTLTVLWPLFLEAVFAGGALGCAESSKPAQAPWEFRAQTGLHSFFFPSANAAPSLVFALHAGSTPDPCGLYRGDSQTTSFSFFKIELNRAAQGSFSVLPGGLMSADFGRDLPLRASVAYIRVNEGRRTARWWASGGTVEVDGAPVSLEEWGTVTEPRLSLSARFPKRDLEQVECQGGASADGQTQVEECLCRDSAGAEERCVPGPEGRDCCVDQEGGTEPVQIQMTTSPCAAMCYAPPLGMADCLRLGP
jgi:hypothetical protein